MYNFINVQPSSPADWDTCSHHSNLYIFQQALLPVSAALSVSLLVTEVVCARDDGEIKTKILSATFFMMGLSTFSMSTFGVRLVARC